MGVKPSFVPGGRHVAAGANATLVAVSDSDVAPGANATLVAAGERLRRDAGSECARS
jgi:hypothetical protein